MQKQVVVAVFDSAVQAFMRPFVAATRGAAQRAFGDEVNRSGSEMNQHADDYTLYFLAEWDETMGTFGSGTPEIIVRGKDVLKGGVS